MDTVKRCPRCNEEKALTEFRPYRDGYQSYCRPCERAYFSDWVKRNPDRVRQLGRESWLRRAYGLEPSDYQQLLDSQGGGCAICETKKEKGRRLPVDHDAVTGKVRGILCTPCNRAIGQMHHDPRRLLNAATYLRRSLSPAP